jgi:hypothetical protein
MKIEDNSNEVEINREIYEFMSLWLMHLALNVSTNDFINDVLLIELKRMRKEGKTSLKVFLTGYFEIARGKRHWTSNYIISVDNSRDSNIGTASTTATTATMSCDLIVFKIEEIPTIFTTGTYIDKLKKVKDIWKFSSRKLNLDSMSWHRTTN